MAELPIVLAASAIAIALISALVSLFATQRPHVLAAFSFPLLGLAGLVAVGTGLWVLVNAQVFTAELPLGLPWLPWRLRLDPLAALFLLIIGVVVTAASVYGPGYVREFEHSRDPMAALGGFTGLFVAGMLAVVLADDAFFFMVAWEIMSLSSYFLVAFHHDQAANRRAAFLYLLMAHVGGLCILLGYGVLSAFGGGFTFDLMRGAALSTEWASIAFALAFIGFGMKAGLVPLHAWLPEAHPAAPSHISALMSGVMLKVAIYGFIRFVFDLLGEPLWGWGVAALVAGVISALVGVLFALMQQDLKRMLAWSSVENVGIIFLALGLSMIFAGKGLPALAVLALVAALYHALNHAMFKSLLFFGAGAVVHATHTRNLEQMGGLLRRMPWTGFAFLAGAISIASLPPLNGFVSEWLTFQSALQVWRLDNGLLRILIPAAAAAMALTAALGAACFVGAYGVAFLGQARSRHARRAHEVSFGMRAAPVFLAVLCLLLGVLPTPVVEVLNDVARSLLGHGLGEATAHGWFWLTPVSPQVASYAAPAVLVGLLLAWASLALVLRRANQAKLRRCDPWDCGFSPPDARMQYAAASYSQPFRRVFGLLFDVQERAEGGSPLRYRLAIGDRSWALVYQPTADLMQAAARRVRFLQSGRIRGYLGWSLGTLVLLLWLIS